MPTSYEPKKSTEPELAGDGLGDAAGTATGDDAEAQSPESTTGHVSEANAGSPEFMRLQEQVTDLTNRLLRTQADFENFRRRVQKEKEDLSLYANQRLILGLLPVLDNLDRALGTPATAGDEKLRQGVELIARSFRELLGREGLSPIEAVGQPFDPNLHEAVMTVSQPDQADDTVVVELQKGYKLGDRVIRPSMVQVNKPD